MASLECRHVSTDGIALVGVRLRTDAPARVTIEPTHEDPVWPPRRQGVPEAGWDDGRWSGVVDPGHGRALGYATPADVGERPVRIVETEPADAGDGEPVTARDVVRALGDHSPARDAVAPPDARDDRETDPATGGPNGAGAVAADSPGVPDLAAIERRLELADALTDVDSADEARAAIEAAGGMAAVRTLPARLDSDRAALGRLRDRAARLADRAGRVDVPVGALARLE